MRTGFTTQGLALTFAVGVLAFAQTSHAQFGGVVFDPTQSAHATQQIVNDGKSLSNQATRIAQGSEENMTLAQQLKTDLALAETALKTYTTAMAEYTTIANNLRYFSTKSIWMTARNVLMSPSVNNSMGETAGLQATLNGQSTGTAANVWRFMNTALAGTSSSFWSGQIVGNSARLSKLASVEANDAVSTQCLNAVAQYNAGRTQNATAESALQKTQFDVTPGANSELDQIDLLNVGHSQAYNESQAQGQLHACMAAQVAVTNMDKRNATTEDLNTWAYVQQQRSMGDAMPTDSSHTWTTYLP